MDKSKKIEKMELALGSIISELFRSLQDAATYTRRNVWAAANGRIDTLDVQRREDAVKELTTKAEMFARMVYAMGTEGQDERAQIVFHNLERVVRTLSNGRCVELAHSDKDAWEGFFDAFDFTAAVQLAKFVVNEPEPSDEPVITGHCPKCYDYRKGTLQTFKRSGKSFRCDECGHHPAAAELAEMAAAVREAQMVESLMQQHSYTKQKISEAIWAHNEEYATEYDENGERVLHPEVEAGEVKLVPYRNSRPEVSRKDELIEMYLKARFPILFKRTRYSGSSHISSR